MRNHVSTKSFEEYSHNGYYYMKDREAWMVTEYFGGVTKELTDTTAEFGQQLVRIGIHSYGHST